MNKVILIGNLTKTPEIKISGNSEKTQKRCTDFIPCIVWNKAAWNKAAEIIFNHANKGDQIGIEGELRINIINDKTYFQIQVTSVELLRNQRKPKEQENEKTYMQKFGIGGTEKTY